MPGIKKRNGWYSVVYSRTVEGKRQKRTLSLDCRNKEYVYKVIKKLDELILEQNLDPFDPDFDVFQLLNAETDNYKPATLEKAFNLFLETKGHLKHHTVKGYKENIHYFFEYCHMWNAPLHSLKPEIVERFIFRANISANTARTNARNLNVFFNYLIRKEWIKKNPFDQIMLPKEELDNVKKIPSLAEFTQLFEAFDKFHTAKATEKYYGESIAQYWFKPIIAMFCYAGLRLSEATYNNKIDYSGLKGENLLNDYSLIYLPKGKGRKERYVPISKFLRPYLMEYFKTRGTPGPKEYVFINSRGSHKGIPITGKTVQRAFNFYCREADIPKSRQLHGFRHRVITEWIEDGFGFKEAAEMAGHSSSRVTEKTYTHLLSKNIEKKYRQIEEGK